jgi:HEPN domain-containing protein
MAGSSTKQPEDEVRRLVADWIRKADLDLDTATRLAADGERFRDIAAFHCQQAVEKYLKACLVRHQVEFPRTHDIERLLRILHSVESGIAVALVDAKWLTPFGVEIRYPGEVPGLLPEDQKRAIDLANRVKGAVMAVLAPYLAGV